MPVTESLTLLLPQGLLAKLHSASVRRGLPMGDMIVTALRRLAEGEPTLADQLEGWLEKNLFPIDDVVNFLGDNGQEIVCALRDHERQPHFEKPNGGR